MLEIGKTKKKKKKEGRIHGKKSSCLWEGRDGSASMQGVRGEEWWCGIKVSKSETCLTYGIASHERGVFMEYYPKAWKALFRADVHPSL